MRRFLPLALAALAALGALTACAPAAEIAATPAPSATVRTTATPTPTPTPTVVAGGQLPPAIFGGECSVAVPAGELSAATGIEAIEVTRRDAAWTRSIDNVGGIVCEWHSGNVSGNVTIMPKTGLDGAALSADVADFYFGHCEWDCAWQAESEELWIMGYSSDLGERGRAEADRIGAEISKGIIARSATGGLDWQRDRSQWWQKRTCADLAQVLTERIGDAVTAQEAGYHDPPSPATALADIASRQTWCGFESRGRQLAMAVFESGAAWDLPWGELGEPVDLGVPGVQAYSSTQGGYLGGEVYEATDGVNAMKVEVAPDGGWGAAELAAVFAEAFVAR